MVDKGKRSLEVQTNNSLLKKVAILQNRIFSLSIIIVSIMFNLGDPCLFFHMMKTPPSVSSLA